MKLMAVWTTTWACEPTIAAGHILRIAWTYPHALFADELDKTDSHRKTVVINTKTQLVTRVVCILNGKQQTSIEFLVPRTSSRARDRIVGDLIARTQRCETEHRLAPRQIGFRPNGGAK